MAPVQSAQPIEPAQPALWAHESASAPVPEAPQAASPLLGGLDPDDRLSISAETDDPLDIPAFLRRQAN
jgi:cell division protein FtsZ